MVVRCWSPDDAPLLRALLDDSDAHLRPWVPWMREEPKPLHKTAQWVRKNRGEFDLDQNYRYAMFNLDETELIGETGLYKRIGPGAREIGYLVGRQHTRRGYALEAAAAMTKVGFEISRVEHIEMHCAADNAISNKIPKRLGYTHDETLARDMEDSEGEMHDLMVWVLRADDYKNSEARHIKITAFDCFGERIL